MCDVPLAQGASGAGKTTLMDVLAGRKTGGVASGEVHVNGFPKNQRTFARVMGYVEQVGCAAAAVSSVQCVGGVWTATA